MQRLVPVASVSTGAGICGAGIPAGATISSGAAALFRDLLCIMKQAAAPVSPPINSSWVFTPSASWETPPSKLRTILIQDTRTHSP